MNTQQTTPIQLAVNHHPDLVRYQATGEFDSDAQMVCYFEECTTNLWFVYVEDKEIVNLLSDTVIEALEREFTKLLRAEVKEHNLCMAIDRWESNREGAIQ